LKCHITSQLHIHSQKIEISTLIRELEKKERFIPSILHKSFRRIRFNPLYGFEYPSQYGIKQRILIDMIFKYKILIIDKHIVLIDLNIVTDLKKQV
jgi:hypothetical protein